MLTGKGSRQKKKKCVKATAFPCGFTCLPRMAKSGKEVRCRHKLHGQADTATRWLKQLEDRMSAVNQKRAVKGRSSLFIDTKGSLRQGQSTINPSGLSDKELVKAFLAEKKNGQSKTLLAALGKEINRRRAKQEPAPSSPNPSGLSDRQLVKAFLKEKENRKSSVLLAALGKEIDRRNAKQSATKKDFRKPEFPAEQQKLLNLLTANLAHATKEEAKWIQQDIDDIKTLYPGMKPQSSKPMEPKSSGFMVNRYGGWHNGKYIKAGEGMTRKENGRWVVYPKDVADRLMKKVDSSPSKPKWEQSFEEYKRENWKELVKSDLENEIEKRGWTIKLDKIAKSEGRIYLSDEALKDELERSDKAIAGLRSAKSYEDAAKVWENSYSLLPKRSHEEEVKKAIADGKKVPDEVLKEYPHLVKEKPVLRTGPKPQSRSGITSKQETLAAIVVGELLNAESELPEKSAIAMIDSLRKEGDIKTANRMQRVIDRIVEDDSDKMTRWILDHQDLTPPKLRFNLSAIEKSLGLSNIQQSNQRKPFVSERPKVDMGGFDFSQCSPNP